MKGKIKANSVDRYLRSIRMQIVDLVEPKTEVIEYACGNGDLLFKLAHKIKTGLGIDHSPALLAYANKRLKGEDFSNLNFKQIDLVKHPKFDRTDYAITSLFLHVVPQDIAIDLLKAMISSANTTLVCGFSTPENWKQRFLLWADQRFTQHYQYYKAYQADGALIGLLNKIENIEFNTYETFDPVIKIYKITKTYNP